MKANVLYFAVAFLNHDVIFEECLDGTDECQPREPWAYSWNGNMRCACEYRGFPVRPSIYLHGF